MIVLCDVPAPSVLAGAHLGLCRVGNSEIQNEARLSRALSKTKHCAAESEEHICSPEKQVIIIFDGAGLSDFSHQEHSEQDSFGVALDAPLPSDPFFLLATEISRISAGKAISLRFVGKEVEPLLWVCFDP